MQIVTYAGCAKSSYMQALQEAKKGNWDQVEPRIKEGEQFYRQAHEQHGEILLKRGEHAGTPDYAVNVPRRGPDYVGGTGTRSGGRIDRNIYESKRIRRGE